MKSALHGKSTSAVEVTNVGPEGFWLLLDGRELFVPFKDFPWFRDATIRQITAVERPTAHHLRWPDLDIDLAVESIEKPERYPLVSRVSPANALKASARPRSGKANTSRPRRGAR